jgi:hypothetical protein
LRLTDGKAQANFAVGVGYRGGHRDVAQALDRTTTASEAAIVFLEQSEKPAADYWNARREKYERI